jgi:H+-transporting ATPase
MLGIRVAERTIAPAHQIVVALDAGQMAIVGKDVHATSQLAGERLGIFECHGTAGRMPNMRHREVRRRPIGFEETHQWTVMRRSRLPEYRCVPALVEGCSPAIAIAARAAAVSSQRLKGKRQLRGLQTRHRQEFAHDLAPPSVLFAVYLCCNEHLVNPDGLTTAEASRRLAESGPNAVSQRAPPRWHAFLGKLWGPIPWLLEAAIVLQIALGAYIEAAVVGGLLVFNACLGFLQEQRASTALAALRSHLAPTALARRDGNWQRLAAAELVPGDVISLPLGALVPADATIVSGSILADQSMLTGESIAVDIEPGGLVYAGAIVRRGQAVAEVIATGARTRSGETIELVRVAHGRSTEQRAILAATRALAIANGTVGLLIIAIGLAMALPVRDLLGLSLTALLASIPVALPATFTLSGALAALALARRGVLLTRLSAAHEAAAIDVLCADKTGTLTRNALSVAAVEAMPGISREQLLALAAATCSTIDLDPIDTAIRAAAVASRAPDDLRTLRFVPFDPGTRMSEAVIVDTCGVEQRVAKGALHAIEAVAEVPAGARPVADGLAERGYRVIAIAAGPAPSLKLVGFMALDDPPRDDSAPLIVALRSLGIRTVMVTGDSPTTAAVIAREVGLDPSVCPPDRIGYPEGIEAFSVFARVLPAQKYALVRMLQRAGHVVGMCGDGVNDAPALRQAQIGIAVSSASDVAKSSAAVVLTEPGLQGILSVVREGRAAFQRLLTYTLNMLVKKTEIILFLGIGLLLTGHAVMTPVLMVLLLITNDFLSMSLTTDRVSPASMPSVWHMPRIARAAIVLAACKLCFSASILAVGTIAIRLDISQLQTLSFVTLVLGNQAVLYALRERRHLWASRPGRWVVGSSAVDIGLVVTLAIAGRLMAPLPATLLAALLGAAIVFAFVLDQLKRPVLSAFGVR